MIKALLLIVRPIATWDWIVRAQRGVVFIAVFFLVPLLVLTSAGEAYGLVYWGKWQAPVLRLKMFPVGEAVVFEVMQFALSLGVVFLGAKLVKAVGETFHGRHTFQQAFTVVAYGLSPFFFLRLLDAVNGISPWVSWAIGISLAISALYHGVPRVMQPDPPQAFGLYVASSVLLVLITLLARFITAWYLQGRFTKLEALIASLGARLPF
ncbi:MAG TPA: Yip1 family protein [Candidatus Binatia bacterium]|jgi:hypothetical protein|nr:Yip1 family protein [Candidatus Binatia bacterium]